MPAALALHAAGYQVQGNPNGAYSEASSSVQLLQVFRADIQQGCPARCRAFALPADWEVHQEV